MAFFMPPLTGQPQKPNNAPTSTIKQADYSQWGQLKDPNGKDLLARIYTVDRSGKRTGNYIVEAAITEGSQELASQYSNPFAGSNLDQKFPTLMAAIQNGELVNSIGAIGSGFGRLADTVSNRIKDETINSPDPVRRNVSRAGKAVLDAATYLPGLAVDAFTPTVADIANTAGAKIESLAGRSNFTRINSTMLYSSTDALRLQVTLYLRAWEDAKKEVEEPLSYLERWAVPQAMGQSILDGIFSTTVPPFIALTYAGRTYLPFLIESVSAPIVTERDANFNRLAAVVTLSLVSRTAWDAADVKRLYGY